MKKTELIIIGLLLIMATVFSIGSAQTETTYYCYDNGEWRTCTPSEAILAREAMTRETPRSLSKDEMKALLSSREPFRDYYYQEIPSYDTLTPTPTPTPIPTGFWKSIFKTRLPARNYTLPFNWLHQ